MNHAICLSSFTSLILWSIKTAEMREAVLLLWHQLVNHHVLSGNYPQTEGFWNQISHKDGLQVWEAAAADSTAFQSNSAAAKMLLNWISNALRLYLYYNLQEKRIYWRNFIRACRSALHHSASWSSGDQRCSCKLLWPLSPCFFRICK